MNSFFLLGYPGLPSSLSRVLNLRWLSLDLPPLSDIYLKRASSLLATFVLDPKPPFLSAFSHAPIQDGHQMHMQTEEGICCVHRHRFNVSTNIDNRGHSTYIADSSLSLTKGVVYHMSCRVHSDRPPRPFLPPKIVLTAVRLGADGIMSYVDYEEADTTLPNLVRFFKLQIGSNNTPVARPIQDVYDSVPCPVSASEVLRVFVEGFWKNFMPSRFDGCRLNVIFTYPGFWNLPAQTRFKETVQSAMTNIGQNNVSISFCTEYEAAHSFLHFHQETLEVQVRIRSFQVN